MLKGYATILNEDIPDVVIHKYVVGKTVFYAVDTYAPTLEEGMDILSQAVAHESAMGYRLRFVGHADEEFIIPPRPIDSAEIKRALKRAMPEIISNHGVVVIGFQYDACPPGDTSSKNTLDVMRYCISSGVRVILSTAYTITTDMRHYLSNLDRGTVAVELRVPGVWGAAQPPSLAQLCYITFRLNNQANGTPYALRFGPVLPIPNQKASNLNTIDIEKFWKRARTGGSLNWDDDDEPQRPGQIRATPRPQPQPRPWENANRGMADRDIQFLAQPAERLAGQSIKTDNFIGQRLFIPEYPVVPESYVAVLRDPAFARTVPKMNPSNYDPAPIIQAVTSAWKSGYRVEIFNHKLSSNTTFSKPVFNAGALNKRIQNNEAVPDGIFVANPEEIGATVLGRMHLDSQVEASIGEEQ